MSDTEKLIAQVLDIAIAAGEEVLAVYAGEIMVQDKADGSPLTQADQRAHKLICEGLRAINHLPIISEEAAAQDFGEREQWSKYWLVDPLDGTKEFVHRNDDFSVNIALIDKHQPCLGVVHAPVFAQSFYALRGGVAYEVKDRRAQVIRCKAFDNRIATIATSRSHASKRVETYRQRLARFADKVDIVRMGSSLKICAVAAGRADVYPRLGPTSEWDTAAAHCILEAAGGSITDLDGATLRYNKADLRNPWFIAGGDQSVDWTQFAQGLQPN